MQKTGIKPARNHRENQLSVKNKILRSSGGATQDQQPLAILISSHQPIVYESHIPRPF
jgi:hypothetical protein